MVHTRNTLFTEKWMDERDVANPRVLGRLPLKPFPYSCAREVGAAAVSITYSSPTHQGKHESGRQQTCQNWSFVMFPTVNGNEPEKRLALSVSALYPARPQ